MSLDTIQEFIDAIDKIGELRRITQPVRAKLELSEISDRVMKQHGGGNALLFGHREILRILAVRWIGLAPIEGRRLLLGTASLSVLGYDHDLAEPVVHAWNERGPWT